MLRIECINNGGIQLGVDGFRDVEAVLSLNEVRRLSHWCDAVLAGSETQPPNQPTMADEIARLDRRCDRLLKAANSQGGGTQ